MNRWAIVERPCGTGTVKAVIPIIDAFITFFDLGSGNSPVRLEAWKIGRRKRIQFQQATFAEAYGLDGAAVAGSGAADVVSSAVGGALTASDLRARW